MRASGMLGQLVRYAITGGFVTALGAGLYGLLVGTTTIHPQAAVFAAYVLCIAIGYVLHSRWSFRGHGSRDNTARTTTRFFVVSIVSYAINSFFTWALIDLAALPRWTPVVPMLFVTPVATFALNRKWVFG